MNELCVRHLLREHRDVEKALSELEFLLDEPVTGEPWSATRREDFQWIVETVASHLEHHIQKEDDVLFPALEAFLPRDLGPLAVLRGEHSDVRELFDRMCRAGQRCMYGNPSEGTREELSNSGLGVITLLRDHIYKEDRILFPMVARFLSPERDAALLHKMEEIDRTRHVLTAT